MRTFISFLFLSVIFSSQVIGADEKPRNFHQIQESVKDLSDHLASYDKELTDAIRKGKSKPDDLLVRSRMAILKTWGEDAPISSFSENNELSEALHRQLATLHPKDKNPLTLKSLRALLDHRDSGEAPKVELTKEQLVEIAAILQLENEKKAHGDKKKAPSDEALLRDIATKELGIREIDSPNATPELPKGIKEALEKAYLKEHPEEAEAVAGNGLTIKQIKELLKKPNVLTNAQLLALTGSLAQHNHLNQGNEYQWGIASDIYRNINEKALIANPNRPEPPPLADVRKYYSQQGPASSGDTTPPVNGRRELHDLGKGPSIGNGKPGGARGNSDRSRPGTTGNVPGPEANPENLSPEDLACLNKLRETKFSSEMAATFQNDPGVFHCGMTFVAKDPAKAKETPPEVPGKEGQCYADGVTAKHCLYNGTLSGITIAGVSQVYAYDLDVQSQSEPISGGDDGAHLTLAIPCEDAKKLTITRPMTPTEFATLKGNHAEHFPLLLGKNCSINEDRSINNCGLFTVGNLKDSNPAFAAFNVKLNGPAKNHGSTVQQGDSGSGGITCISHPDGTMEPVWMGAVSYVHGFPGYTGGIASGTFLNHVDQVLSGASNPNGSFGNPADSESTPQKLPHSF